MRPRCQLAPGRVAAPGGAVIYWHVDDVAAALDRLVSMGVMPLEVRTHVPHQRVNLPNPATPCVPIT